MEKRYTALSIDDKDDGKTSNSAQNKPENQNHAEPYVPNLKTKEELIEATNKSLLKKGVFEADSAVIIRKKTNLLKDWEDWLSNQEIYNCMINYPDVKEKILNLILSGKFGTIDGLLESITNLDNEGFVKHLDLLKKELSDEIFRKLLYIIPNKSIQLACKYAHPEILQFLIDKKELISDDLKSRNGRNLFHQTVRSLAPFERSKKCLKILLKQLEDNKTIIDINKTDDHGRTPLHYAVMHKNERCVLTLLKNGAYIDAKDNLKQTPLSNMTEAAFQKFLDSMISFKTYDKSTLKDNAKDKDYDLEFNFDNIFQKAKKGNFNMDLLKKIKRETRLKKFIAHPIISIIIHFQWYRIRLCFYFYIFFYMLFTGLYTSYIILDAESQNSTNVTLGEIKETYSPQIFSVSSCVILFIFTLLEIVKITGENWSKLRYWKSLDNVIRFVTFLFSWSVLILNEVHDSEFIRLKSISILFVWFELFLVFAKYPPLTYHIITFRSASIRLLKFLFVHSILIFGFAFSFHILFRKSSAEIFHNPFKAIFKTVIMLTSEFDAHDIPFDNYSGASHIIFVFYIFVVTIVLFNLMIALAFSKVNDMEKNPLLYRSFTEIDMIIHFERYYLESQNGFHEEIQKLIFSFFHYSFRVFLFVTCQKLEEPGILEKQIITMKKNKMQQFIIFETYPERLIKFVKIDDYISTRVCPKIFSWLLKNKLDYKIVNNAWEIATKRLTEKQSKINKQ